MGNTATKYHPLTGAPLRPIWVRPDGRVMWPIMGGDDTVPPADPPADPPPSDPPPADPPQDPPADPAKGGKDAILANLAKERDKRQELEQTVSEMQTAHQAQMDALAKAFGIKPDDEPPDPAKLAEQITAAQGETAAEKDRADAAERALAVFKRALDPQAGLNANPIALLDSNTFLTSLNGVDHTDTEKLDEAIKAAVEVNPLLKSSSPTPPFPGGPRPSATPRAGSLGEAIANKLAATRPS